MNKICLCGRETKTSIFTEIRYHNEVIACFSIMLSLSSLVLFHTFFFIVSLCSFLSVLFSDKFIHNLLFSQIVCVNSFVRINVVHDYLADIAMVNVVIFRHKIHLVIIRK